MNLGFKDAYQKLNSAQKKAVDIIDGPVIVMAGPGTGKTQVLTVRIANILTKTDTDPSAILALTFTENAAKEMKARLISLIGKDGYHVRITTFHSFCNDIISENPEIFSRPAGSQAATELEKIEIVTKILETGSYLFLKPINNPTLFLRDIISSISDLKREGISEKKFSQMIRNLTEEFEAEKDSLGKTAFTEKEKLIGKNIDLLSIYKQYQENLAKIGRFDFEDMINWVVDAFSNNEELLLRYQEKFQYILVDEYQDTNSAQNNLIFALASFWGEMANVFVVGDPNQSIFRFQGASQENVRQFEKKYPKAKRIVLTENYRSTSSILKSAAKLIEGDPLHDNSPHKIETIKVIQFNSSVFEDEYLLKSITEKIKNGTSPSDIAIIVKENREVDHLANLMKQRGIPYKVGGGTNILTTPLISQFLKILRVVVCLSGSLDDLEIFTVLNYPHFKLDKLEVLKLARAAHEKKCSLLDILSLRHSDRTGGGISKTFDLFVSWSHQSSTHTLPEMFQIIFQESGFLNFILTQPQPVIELNRFGTLYEDVKKQLGANPKLDLFGYVKNLATMEDHGLKLEEKELISNSDAVTITTAHKSKGLEWSVVYIYRFADTHWGNKSIRQMIKLPENVLDSKPTKDDKNDEERRLFYVALTRAKDEIHLSGANSYSSSSKMTFPAMFLSDLPDEHLEKVDTSVFEKTAVEILCKSLSQPRVITVEESEDDFLDEIIKSFKLSPTALNSYLECHYKFKLDNLYRIPRAKAPAMCFGTAVHFALEKLYQQLNKSNELKSKSEFLNDFETALAREVLTRDQYQDRLLHGRKILSAYYDHYHDEFKKTLFTERNFGHSIPIMLGDIPLSGKSDRIDSLDQKDKTVRFVDYKTGAPKTRGMLEKEGEGPEGNYKRQLTFYHLLADLDKNFEYKVTETELDFIEPDKAGKFHQERFNISQDEVENLKATLTNTMNEIRSHNFDRTTDTSICARCDFRPHCWPNGIPPSIDA